MKTPTHSVIKRTMEFCSVTTLLRRRRSWLRYVPFILLLTGFWLTYKRRSTVDLDEAIMMDDTVYRQALMEHRQPVIASLKAGIVVHVAMALVFVSQDPHASANAKDTVTWLVVYSSAPVHFHILSDSESLTVIDTIMKRAGRQANCQFTYTIDLIDQVMDHLLGQLDSLAPRLKLPMMREHVVGHLLPLLLPWYYPQLDRLVWLTGSIKLRTDISELQQHFELFQADQVAGMTLTQGAQFASAFAVYRYIHGGQLGLSPPLGWPGFNAQLMLLDLDKMRKSSLIKRYIDLENQFYLIEKYEFKGRKLLPDLDEWLTLIAAEQPGLFYTLPCQWNVQQVMDEDAFQYCRNDIKAMEFDPDTAGF